MIQLSKDSPRSRRFKELRQILLFLPELPGSPRLWSLRSHLKPVPQMSVVLSATSSVGAFISDPPIFALLLALAPLQGPRGFRSSLSQFTICSENQPLVTILQMCDIHTNSPCCLLPQPMSPNFVQRNSSLSRLVSNSDLQEGAGLGPAPSTPSRVTDWT